MAFKQKKVCAFQRKPFWNSIVKCDLRNARDYSTIAVFSNQRRAICNISEHFIVDYPVAIAGSVFYLTEHSHLICSLLIHGIRGACSSTHKIIGSIAIGRKVASCRRQSRVCRGSASSGGGASNGPFDGYRASCSSFPRKRSYWKICRQVSLCI